MNESELNELDRLLSKLQAHLQHRFVISTGLQDNYAIGIYDNRGTIIEEAHKETVLVTVNELLEKQDV